MAPVSATPLWHGSQGSQPSASSARQSPQTPHPAASIHPGPDFRLQGPPHQTPAPQTLTSPQSLPIQPQSPPTNPNHQPTQPHPYSQPPFPLQEPQPQWGPPAPYPPNSQIPLNPYNPYAIQPGSYAYPPPPPKKHHFARVLLSVLCVILVFALVRPVVAAITSGGYANSTYVAPQPNSNPPALPRVGTEATGRETVASSSLYAQNVPTPTKCTVTSIDLSAASDSSLQTHMSDVVECLMRVWDTPVTKSGFELPRPPVVVYSKPVSSSCGKLPMMNAVYCSSDQKIFYATDLPQAIPANLRSSRFIVELIVAHEFGHAVQARTGILTAGHALVESATSQNEAHELSRRIELQADCLAGLFIRSVSKSTGISQPDLDNIAALVTAFGDDSQTQSNGSMGDHGYGETRKYWTQLGLASTAVGACNTYTAVSDLVR